MSQLPKRIGSIRFGLLSPETIRRMSVVQIVIPDTLSEDGTPVPNGLMDPALGTIDPGQRCRTCGNRLGECPGHFGHIELARPVVHVGFNKVIYKMLQATCHECGSLLLEPHEIETYRSKQLEHIRKWEDIDEALVDDALKRAAKNKDKLCPHCGAQQHKVKLDKPTTYFEEIITEDGQKYQNKITPLDIQNRFKAIKDEDLPVLGLNPDTARPEWMVLTVLPVPPVAVRPSITLDSGIRSEDDLTHKLVDIIRINQRLYENREAGAPQLIVEDLWELLQYHVTTYFDNEVSGIPPARHRSGRALRTLTQRLKGKEGRFRSNLSGKRVDFSARTVISPDPLLSINEVGVPQAIAEILTVPERVTEFNIEEMKELVIRGPDGSPGANYIIRDDGRRVDLRYSRDRAALADTIKPGFIIERHLRDGDIVLFNRQPSLHRMSIMAHRVRIMPGKTFRLNLSVCRPYNADFDGDEMNLHVPQTEEARAEAHILMSVQEQISTPRYGGPIIGAIQDFITSAYFLTRDGSYYTKEQASQLLIAAGIHELPEPDSVDEKGNPLWSGKLLFSQVLPKTMNFSMKNKLGERVVIRNGRLLNGSIDKEAFGAEVPESVLHHILKEYGSSKTREFLDSITRMLIENITRRGFSIGLDGVDLPHEARDRIRETIRKHKEQVDRYIEAYKNGELERLPGRTLEETLESHIMKELAEARNESGEIASKYLGMKNEIVIMAKTGARGNMLNVGQMAACVGQQSVRGKRIQRGYKNRTLPHFKPGDLSAESRGFVDASFRTGLSPVEYFFHAAGGREGLVDTAVRTSTSGYMQRRLINALQDLSSGYDGTVRNSDGHIIQFKFGGDNVDPAKSDHGKAVNIDTIIDRILSVEEEEAEA